MSKNNARENDRKEPYLVLRSNIGVLAIALPLIVVIGAAILPPNIGMQGSISAYYHSEMRNVFVGILFATGVFLFTYNPGYFNKNYGSTDQIFGILAAIFAIGVAFFPTARADVSTPVNYPEGLYHTLHVASTGLFLLTLIVFSYFLFTKSSKKRIPPGSDKAKRNRVYKVCALIMSVCVVLLVAYYFYGKGFPEGITNPLEQYHPVFWLELAAIWAFGYSWFVKGETLQRYRQFSQESAKSVQRWWTKVRH